MSIADPTAGGKGPVSGISGNRTITQLGHGLALFFGAVVNAAAARFQGQREFGHGIVIALGSSKERGYIATGQIDRIGNHEVVADHAIAADGAINKLCRTRVHDSLFLELKDGFAVIVDATAASASFGAICVNESIGDLDGCRRQTR